jgi:hypothetical protein
MGLVFPNSLSAQHPFRENGSLELTKSGSNTFLYFPKSV